MKKEIKNAAKKFFKLHDGDMDKHELGLHEWSMQCFVAGYDAAQLAQHADNATPCTEWCALSKGGYACTCGNAQLAEQVS